MFTRIRICCQNNKKLPPLIISRHSSFIKPKSIEDRNIPNSRPKDTYISSKIKSFLNDSLDSIEDYIIKQTPEYEAKHSLTNTQNDDRIPSLNKKRKNLPAEIRKYNDKRSEFLDIRNQQDINYLLSLKSHEFKSVPEISQSIELNGFCNIPQLLRFYVCSLPEVIEMKPSLANSPIKLHTKSLLFIVSLLVNHQWFRNASYIICRRNLPFNDLVDALNSLIENEPIFQRSGWMKYMFLIEFLEIYKDINPLIIKQISFLSTPYASERFQILNALYGIKFTSESQLITEMKLIEESGFGDDVYVQLMYNYKLVEVIKNSNLFKPTQYNKFKNILSKVKPIIPKNETYYASLVRHMCCLSEEETNYILMNDIPTKSISQHLQTRTSTVFKHLILNDNTHIGGMDMFALLQCDPKGEYLKRLWMQHLNRTSLHLQGTIYYKMIINAFYAHSNDTKLRDEVVNVQFVELSHSNRMDIINKSLLAYFKNNTMKERNTAGKYIGLLTDYQGHSQVMGLTMKKFFIKGEFPELNNIATLFKLMELISSFSPTVYNKRKLFERANSLIVSRRSVDFQIFGPNERFDKLIQMMNLIKSNDTEAPQYLISLNPSLILAFQEYANENKIDSKSLKGDERFHQLTKELNHTFEIVCSNSDKILSAFNPRNYPSKVYLSFQTLLQKCATVLRNKSIGLLEEVTDSFIVYTCAPNERVNNFNRKINSFGIFLEVFLRRSTRSIESNHDPETLSPARFSSFLKKETRLLANDNTTWSVLQRCSNFTWKYDIKELIKVEDGSRLGDGISFVFNELKNNKHIKSAARRRGNNGNRFENFAVENESSKDIDYVTNSMFDSMGSFNNDGSNNDLNVIDDKDSKGLLEQDFLEYNEIYQNLKGYQDYVKDKKNVDVESLHLDNTTRAKSNKSKTNAVEVKKMYTLKERERLLRFYGPIRMKCLIIESIIEDNPFFVDKLLVKLYQDYEDLIPISILHSVMIGILKSDNCDFDFCDKLNVIKVLDLMVAMSYSGGTERSQTYFFMHHVRYIDFRTQLVDVIIKESKRSNSGSLKTLNWAMNKIVNSPNLDGYKPYLKKWTNELNNMKEMKIGFWNKSNINNVWIRDKR